MRPEILYPLFADITTINGLGEKGAKLVERLLGGRKILDLAFHLPSRHYRPEIFAALKAGPTWRRLHD